jgi:hypothetical protein
MPDNSLLHRHDYLPPLSIAEILSVNNLLPNWLQAQKTPLSTQQKKPSAAQPSLFSRPDVFRPVLAEG